MVTFFSLVYKHPEQAGACFQKFLRPSVGTVRQGKKRLLHILASLCPVFHAGLHQALLIGWL